VTAGGDWRRGGTWRFAGAVRLAIFAAVSAAAEKPVLPAAQTPTVPQGSRKLLSAELRELVDRFQDRPVRLADITEVLKGRGYDLLLILLTIPFLTPIPLPFLSTPFGLIIALAGLRLALGQKPWWPRRLLAKELPPQFLSRLLRASGRIVRIIEYCVRPRWSFISGWPPFQRASGALVCLSGLLLLLPIPVPFTNTLPAISILILASSALERDGFFFLLGLLVFAVAVAYFSLILFGGVAAGSEIWSRLRT